MPPERYDLVVIGGGIHGVGVAQASAARGYRTLVLERDRLAAGTSSRSSKLIHGGLRYLAQFQLSLVKTSLRERETLLRIAPQLVKRVDFHVPVYGNSRYGSLRLHAGLSLYAFLAGFGDHAQFSRLDPDELAGLDGLSTEGLKTVYRYPDAQTDDVELTQAVMRSAKQLGAELRCPAHFTGARRDGGSYVIEFESGEGERERVVAATVVNAAGPWIDAVLDRFEPRPETPRFDLVQGSHVIVPESVTRGVYYVESIDDRRPLFVMPWYENTLIGTTETLFEGDPSDVRPLDSEIDYLLRTYRHYFPGRPDDAISQFAGLRVLPRRGSGLNTRPRETALLTDQRSKPRLVSIAGGKLTAYRATAEEVLDRLKPSLPEATPIAQTDTLTL